MELLKTLVALRGASGDEQGIRDFLINYFSDHSKFKTSPILHFGKGFGDCLIVVFGTPRTSIYAHIDTIGYTIGYDNELIKIGGPATIDGTKLVGLDRLGEIETELQIIDLEDGSRHLRAIFSREIERGTNLTYKPNFRETDEAIQSPYMDNRLGVWNALKVAENLENGALVFSTYEEHGGNTVGYCARFLLEKYNVDQALISDITWVTDGVQHGGGVAISIRDSSIPRRSYLNKVLKIAQNSGLSYQLEVESAGGSDGSAIQKTGIPVDWLFIGAPEDNVHTSNEKVFKKDIASMLAMYNELMEKM
jgi:putative aminopeptidase FrvX